MGQLTRHLGRSVRQLVVPLLGLALTLGAAGCGGASDGGADGATGGGAAGSGGDTAPAEPTTVKTVRWPRFWATVDSAEAGSSDALRTAYFAGYDDTSVVYTGQDVIRFLDLETGKQRRQQVLEDNRLVCNSQPRRQIENQTVLIGTGTDDVAACDVVEAYDVTTGKLKWTYGTRGKGGEMTIDQRDGIVLFAMSAGPGQETAGVIAGVDAETGTQLWRRQVPHYFFGRGARKDDDCFINPALAADRPVVIAFLGCSDFATDARPALYGIDLETGQKLWRTDFWDDPEYMYVTDGQKVHPHLDDGRTLLKTEVNTPVRVDSETGEVSPVEEPAPKKIKGHAYWWPACDDFRSHDDGSSREHSDTCAFTDGEVTVFARDKSFGKESRMRIEGRDADTGKPLWEWEERRVDKPDEYEFHDFEFLGFNSDRSEFWVARDGTDVIRLDTLTGERVGQGLAAPPMRLVNFGVSGPEFLLTRTVGGITGPDGSGVKSGLNFYRIDAP